MVAHANASVFATITEKSIRVHGSLLPALGFKVVGMHMAALFSAANHLANVLAIFDGCIASAQILQGDLVTNGNISFGSQIERRIVFRHHTKHVGACGQPLNDDHTNIVLFVMHQQMRNAHNHYAGDPTPSV